MLTAFPRAFGQLFDQRIVRILAVALIWSILCFVGLWGGIAWTLANTSVSSWPVVDTVIDALGGLATLLLTWFLFPVVVSAMIGLFLEPVAAAVEARHYPGLPRAPGLGIFKGLRVSLRFLIVAVLLNALLLLVLLVLPASYPLVYMVVNGYLLGREYFELAGLRRSDPVTVKVLRSKHRLAIVLGGMVIALLMMAPVVNLLAPVLAVMAMVHAYTGWRPAG
jgi:uncharacterized protein involved in cysteine biosynthesis